MGRFNVAGSTSNPGLGRPLKAPRVLAKETGCRRWGRDTVGSIDH